MSDHDHDHHGHPHGHDHDHGPTGVMAPEAPAPASAEDAGSQALAEALRSSFAIVRWLMLVMLVVFLCSGIFTVGPQEKAIKLHLGRPAGEGSNVLLGPGLHWAWPYPVDEIVKIPSAEIQRVSSTVGWYQTTPEQEFSNTEPPAGPSLNPAIDGYTITGDRNIIHTRATLSYRIDNPVRYTFDFVTTSNAVQSALDNALLYASSRFAVDDVLTRERTRFQEVVQQRVNQLVQQEDLGIVVEQCTVDSRPPRQCRDAFNAVLTAVSTRDTVHNQALSYENEVLTRSAAQATAITNAAQAERVRLVGAVQAEAERFTSLQPQYDANPQLFANLLLTEKIGQVLTNAQDKIYLPERADGKTRELRLQLSREPLKPAPVNGTNP